MLHILKKAFGLIGAERRRRFMLLGLFALVVSAAEAVAAVMVLLMLELVVNAGTVPALPLIGNPTQWFPTVERQQLLLWYCFVFATFFVARAVVFLLQQHAVERVSENTGVLVARRLLAGYLSMPYELHLERNSAESIRNTYENVRSVVEGVFRPTAALFAESVVVAAILCVLIVASPVTALTAALLTGATVWLILHFVQPRLKELGERRQRALTTVLQTLQQGLGGIREIKINGRERTFVRAFTSAAQEKAIAGYWRQTLAYVPRVGMETSFLLLVLIVVAWSVISGTSDTILATLGLFAYAGLRLQPSLQKIAAALNSLRFVEPAVDELVDDFTLIEETDPTTVGVDDQEPLELKDELLLDNVGYRYPKASVDALTGVSLTIRAGESIGICGRTGGGKTTLVDLISGLLSPTTGRVVVDGVDVAGNFNAWRRGLGVVHQSPFLTDDSLRRNIALGLPDDEVDELALTRAVEVSQLRDLISTLPHGLNTIVGERGIRLSGGQRQRVAIARAVYRQPTLMILDEGTSALDNTTEADLMAAVEQLRGETTLLIVAHRLSTVERCDRIVFLRDGRVDAVGKFDELRQLSDDFRRMAG